MRDNLAFYECKYVTLIGKFLRYGIVKSNKEQKTMLITNVQFEDGRFACEHIWVTCRDYTYIDSKLSTGDTVRVDGVVSRYTKSQDRKQLGVTFCRSIKIVNRD